VKRVWGASITDPSQGGVGVSGFMGGLEEGGRDGGREGWRGREGGIEERKGRRKETHTTLTNTKKTH